MLQGRNEKPGRLAARVKPRERLLNRQLVVLAGGFVLLFGAEGGFAKAAVEDAGLSGFVFGEQHFCVFV